MISNRPGNNIKRVSDHHSLQWNTIFFSQVKLMLLCSHLFLLPPSFVVSLMAFDIKYLWICLSVSPFWLFRGLRSALNMLKSWDFRDFPSLGQYNRVGLAPGQQNFSLGPGRKSMCPAPVLAPGYMEFNPGIQSRLGLAGRTLKAQRRPLAHMYYK